MIKFVRPALGSLFLLLLLVPLSSVHGAAERTDGAAQLPRPSAGMQPGEVVRIVIDALANNDYPYPDAGVETTFNFASPSNKALTGPLDRFVRLVKGPVFGQMINHRDSTLSKVVLEGDKAIRLVQIVGANNEMLYFAFRLGLQQEGEYEGMWLTEAVWPLQGPDVLAI